MDNWEIFVKQLLEAMGFAEIRLEIDATRRHGQIFIADAPLLLREHQAAFIEHLNHLLQLMAKKNNQDTIFFDINNYRRQRENLIAELARAAAQKVLATNQDLALPPMNSYERRIIHLALAHHPTVATESLGLGRARYVVVKPLGQVTVIHKAAVTPSLDITH